MNLRMVCRFFSDESCVIKITTKYYAEILRDNFLTTFYTRSRRRFERFRMMSQQPCGVSRSSLEILIESCEKVVIMSPMESESRNYVNAAKALLLDRRNGAGLHRCQLISRGFKTLAQLLIIQKSIVKTTEPFACFYVFT